METEEKDKKIINLNIQLDTTTTITVLFFVLIVTKTVDWPWWYVLLPIIVAALVSAFKKIINYFSK